MTEKDQPSQISKEDQAHAELEDAWIRIATDLYPYLGNGPNHLDKENRFERFEKMTKEQRAQVRKILKLKPDATDKEVHRRFTDFIKQRGTGI